VFSVLSVLVMRVTRATYRLAGEGRPSVYASIESNRTLDSRSLVPSRGELLSNKKLRLGPSGSVIGGKATLVEFYRRRLSTFCGLFSTKLAPLHPLRILSSFTAFTRARINISIHSEREMRCILSREVALVLFK
jgi:hypothetical protein